MSTVLLIGEDLTLLETRAAVLRSTGAEILCADPVSSFAVQQERECDLVVLCHSLREDICVALAEALRRHWPKTQILLVIPDRDGGFAEARDAVDGVSSTEPERLIQKTAELLRRAELVRGERRVAYGVAGPQLGARAG
jgi:DNA-binding response OmpR family regulator